jgi:hypothetical protein
MLVLKPTDELTRKGWLIDQNKKETRDENIGIGSWQLQECGMYLRNDFVEPQIYESGDDAKGITRPGGLRRAPKTDSQVTNTKLNEVMLTQ